MNVHTNNRHAYWWIGLYISVCAVAIVAARIFVAVPAATESVDGESVGGQENERTAATTPPAAPAPDVAPPTAKLLFFGDIMLDRNVKALMEKNGGVGYVFERWQLPPSWQNVDMAMANMEGAVTENGEHYPPAMGIDFAFDEADVAQLRYYGFDTFTIANNHLLDQGRAGVTETREQLQRLGYRVTGCPDGQVAACSVATTTVRDMTIGLAGYSMVYGLLDEAAMAEQVRALASSTDVVIANVHWGVEYTNQHNKTQERVAHALVDAGADLVIGHHPHVVQDMERYQGVPIFYSLGNFIFDQYFSAETQEGFGVGVMLVRNGGNVVIDRIDPLPYRSARSQVELLKGEEREAWVDWFRDL